MIRPLLCSLALFPIIALSQTLHYKQDSTIKRTIASQFGPHLAKGLDLNLGRLNFQILNQDTLFNPNGFNYVFKLKGDSSIRLDHCIFHGYNNQRFLFVYHDTLFALGGYGHFTTNNNLISFNFRLKEWCFVDCQGEAPPFIRGSAYKNGNFVYSFNNFKGGNNVKPDLYDPTAYRLNLQTKEWQRITSAFLKKHLVAKEAYHTDDYLVLVYNLYTLVIETNSQTFIEIKNEDFGFASSSAVKKIDGNLLFFEPYDKFQEELTELNLDVIWQKNLSRSTNIDWEVQGKAEFVTLPIALLIGFFTFIIGWYFLSRLKKQKTLPATSPAEDSNELLESPLISKALYEHDKDLQKQVAKRLLAVSKPELTIEEIDHLLEISHLLGDSRKLRRHRIFKTFPDGAISRNKSTADGRSYTYTLNKPLIEKWLKEGLNTSFKQ